jgi:hypothetical protein
MHICAVDELERVVEEWEQKLHEREWLENIKLDHEHEALTTRESNLDSREATLEAEQTSLEDARLNVTARELAADIRKSNPNTRVVVTPYFS